MKYTILPVLVGTLLFAGLYHAYGSQQDRIKECNRKGGIYTTGTCQHVFAPICRRL